ncbi:MAG: HAMP domain-containing histidine kinase [Anaerolineae bacterium]|nr:HAMP domain-containing histidine kinase [Anaerolineae bacterium]
MSIRLRLTLTYTLILALTLVGFSAIVYGIQAGTLLVAEEQRLETIVQRAADRPRLDEKPENDESEWGGFNLLPPFGSGEGLSRTFGMPDTYFQFVDLDGEVSFKSGNLGDVVLPLSVQARDAVMAGETWTEVMTVEGERVMIASRLVVVDDGLMGIFQVAGSLTRQYEHLGRLRNIFVLGSLGVTIATFGIGWVLSGVVLRPIKRITQTAQAIGAEQDLSKRVAYDGPPDEIGRLVRTFNTMLGQLHAAYHQVEQSLRQQRQFVADVSHELRTPLTTVRGNLALLQRDPPIDASEQDDILSDMVGESDRLIRLVNDLLALAHAESGRALRIQPVQLGPLVEDVCRRARYSDERLSIAHASSSVTVAGDEDAIKQMLLILVDNALKHTDGPVVVELAEAALHAEVSVRDSGPGIGPHVLPHVFERFYRGEDSRKAPGIGLGLAIAKALVEAQSGTLSVESLVGKGTVFTLTLPLAEASAAIAGSQPVA